MGLDERILEDNMFKGIFGGLLRRIRLPKDVYCQTCSNDLTIEGGIIGEQGVYCRSNRNEVPCYHKDIAEIPRFYDPVAIQIEIGSGRLTNYQKRKEQAA